MGRETQTSTGQHDSSVAGTANTRTTETRRSHKKSRNGCTECKRRHIRCDERQPSCANCEVAERACVFPPPKVGKQRRKRGQQRHASQQHGRETTTTSPTLPDPTEGSVNNIDDAEEHNTQTPLAIHQQNSHSELGPAVDQPTISLSLEHGDQASIADLEPTASHPPSDCHPGLIGVPNVASKTIFTPQHMILMHHAHTVPNFTGPNRSIVDIAIRHAVDSPYLLDEILAFTAFDMVHLYPGSAVCLRHLATELQTRALASFTLLTETVPKDDKATAVPRFLFSAILGRHVLADTLAHYRSDFHSFIDRLVECFNLNRGITSVTPPAKDYLYNSEIQPFLNVVLKAHKKIVSPGTECDPLTRLLNDSDLSETSMKACRHTIELLQWSFDLCRGLDEEEYPSAASSFSVKIEGSFVDMLRKHRPEALVILAYYGVLLHRCRSFWAFGDAGASMIRAIAGHLGSYWRGVLEWPLRVIETECNSEPVAEATTPGTLTLTSHASQ
ncbi:Upc2 protein [Colletotrichum gloeosporioides Cg-14]|uniref:Upc2 protein n=1 Tax=Colletotrichum gloeosporioides (strain Cg-14) TaxID=1237896 RepID=T0KX14_COLGC|nr:Upc2 protein [Colletotrichum gloeosporioides Cg-14]